MQKLEQIYEGKAKKVFKTDDPELLIVDYKDDATAFNGLKKGTILGKGVINNQMTNRLMAKMEKAGLHRPSGGHCPQYLRRFLRQALRRGGGHCVRSAHHRVFL